MTGLPPSSITRPQKLKTIALTFRKNGLPYRLIQRNDFVALYGIGATFTDRILHYEVCRIHIRDDQYGRREALPSNEQFGRDESRAILNYREALEYYEELTSRIIIDVEASNDVKSGIENSEVDSDVTSEGLSPPIKS